MRTPPLLPTQSPASTETPLVLLCKKQPHSAENQPGAGSTPCGQAGLRRSAPVPRRDAQQGHKGENEPLWRPTAWKWGVFCTGGIWSFFLPFFELSFCCRAPPASSGCKAGVTGPGRSPPLRSTPPNPRCQRILPQPDTSLDPLPVTSSSTLHLSS